MSGFKMVNSSKLGQSQQPSLNAASSQSTANAQIDDEKEEMLKRCYEMFMDFPLEDQQKIISIIQPQPQMPVKEKDQIYDIINYLIEKDKTMPSQSQRQRINLIASQPRYEIIMRVFEGKFAQMTKSKEEMIKFCMRKAFKFVYDKIVSQKKQKLNKKEQKQLKNEYFGISNESEYALPFREDSSEKTMNDDFLKKTFALKNFINDYKLFLDNYDEILEKDNKKKIDILVDQILETTDSNFEQGLIKIKRIPWSREILEQTKQLASFLLMKYGTFNEQAISSPTSQVFGGSDSKNGNNMSMMLEGNILGEASGNQQNINQINGQGKQKQILIAFDEFRKILLTISQNSPIFKDLVSNLQKDFIKAEPLNDPMMQLVGNDMLPSSNFTHMNEQECVLSKEDNHLLGRAEGMQLMKLEEKEQNLSFAPMGLQATTASQSQSAVFQKQLNKEELKQESNLLESPDIHTNLKDKQVHKFTHFFSPSLIFFSQTKC